MSELQEITVNNIYLFVMDCLRYDFLPQKIENMGVTIKGIASGSQTRFSVPSLVTGVYPSTHNIQQDFQKLRGFTFFDLPINTAFNTYSEEKRYSGNESPLRWWMGDPKISYLEEMHPPFIFYEHNWELHAYHKYIGNDSWKSNNFQRAYEKGIEFGVETFRSRMDYLEDKNLLDNTLVIFTADHGEILGEFGGIYDHNFPICPEIVYIPMVFIHPDLDSKIIDSGIARLVDIFPTILDFLGLEFEGLFFEGESLLRGRKKFGICEYRYPPEACSIWTDNGGYVKIIDYKYPKVIHILNRILRRDKNLSFEAIKYLKPVTIYGEINEVLYKKRLESFLKNVPKNKLKYRINKIKYRINKNPGKLFKDQSQYND